MLETRVDRKPGRQSSVEGVIEELWKSVLDDAAVDHSANFFELGGSSLSATLLIAQVNESLDVNVGLGEFMQAPEIRALVGVVHEHLGSTAGTLTADDSPGAQRPASRPTENQAFRLDGVYRDPSRALRRGLSPEHGLITVRIHAQGRLDPRRIAWAFEDVVRKHDVLRSCFSLVDDEWRVSLAPSAQPEVRFDSKRDLEWERRPFDLHGGSWLRAAVVQSVDSAEIVVVTDHLVWDGYSDSVLMEEIAAAYRSEAAGPLVPYYEWATAESNRACGSRGAELASKWRRQLAGTTLYPPFPLQPPSDRSAAPTDVCASIRLGSEEDVRRRIASAGSLLSAWVLTLWFSAIFDIEPGLDAAVAHLPVANRDSETSRTIGWMANVMAVPYTRFDHEYSWGQREAVVLERVIFAMEHADLPLHTVVPDLDPMTDERAPRVFANAGSRAGTSRSGQFSLLADPPGAAARGGAFLDVDFRDASVWLELSADPHLVDASHFRDVAERVSFLAHDGGCDE